MQVSICVGCCIYIIGRYFRGHTNLCSNPYSVYLCSLVNSRFQRCFSMKVRLFKNSTCVQICTYFWFFQHHIGDRVTLRIYQTNYVLCHSRILVRASLAYLRSGTYIYLNTNFNLLRDGFLFKFVLLLHILVSHTNIFFCERLNFNIFMGTFVHFDIVVLTRYDFTSYSIVFPM